MKKDKEPEEDKKYSKTAEASDSEADDTVESDDMTDLYPPGDATEHFVFRL